MKPEETSGTVLTKPEFLALKRGTKVLLKQGEGGFRLEAITVVEDHFQTHIILVIEEVLFSGGSFNPPIIRTSRVIGNLGEISALSSTAGAGSKKSWSS
jgi:hypothetical protein